MSWSFEIRITLSLLILLDVCKEGCWRILVRFRLLDPQRCRRCTMFSFASTGWVYSPCFPLLSRTQSDELMDWLFCSSIIGRQAFLPATSQQGGRQHNPYNQRVFKQAELRIWVQTENCLWQTGRGWQMAMREQRENLIVVCSIRHFSNGISKNLH